MATAHMERNTATETTAPTAKRIRVDDARIDRLKDLYVKTPLKVDYERVRFMKKIYEENAGYQQIVLRATFLAYLLDHKRIYIDDNLFVGSMTGDLNGVYTYPEWSIAWMKEDDVIADSKTPEDREANEWVLKFWEHRGLKPRVDEIFKKKFGYDPNVSVEAGLFMDFCSWPGGGGNLNYPLMYHNGVASVIKDVEARQAELDIRLPNAPKIYFYEACLIVMRAVVRFSNRYAKLARDMAAKEANAERKQELLDIAEVCEHVPEHPARNLREAMQSHFLCHIVGELEQVGCGYSEAYFGQLMDPYYQAEKAAGTLGPDEATHLLKNLWIKLNEVNYWYGKRVGTMNSADLGQSITLGGFTPDGGDATAEMDYLILDASSYLALVPVSVPVAG